MANQIEELINVPVEFWNDGVQFSKRCTKRKDTHPPWTSTNSY